MAGSLDDHGQRRRIAPKSYPRFWPSLTLDYLWTITEQNDLYRWLLEPLRLERPVVGRHFFELLLDPAFNHYQEANHDWHVVVVHALRCFIGQTEPYSRPEHRDHAAYEAVMTHLRTTLPEFAALEEFAGAQNARMEPGTIAGSLCAEGAVVLPWPVDLMIPLAFSAIFQREFRRARSAWRSPYQVTLAPATDAVAIATVLVYFDRVGWAHKAAQAGRDEQLRWGLTLIETLIATQTVGRDKPEWELLREFEAVRRTIAERFPGPADELTEEIVAAIRQLWEQTHPPQRASSLAFVMKFCQNEGLSYLIEIFMSKEAHPLYIGSKFEFRPDNMRQLQTKLNKSDAALVEDLREAHPVRALDEIRAAYPNQWIALQPIRVDPGFALIEGRVFEVADDRDPVQERVTALRQDMPGLNVYAYFTGPSSRERAARRG